MKAGLVLAAGMLLLMSGAALRADAPTLEPGVYIYDGKKDLIVGESNGKICYYENKNTDADPVFEGYTYLQDSTGNVIDVE